MALCSEKIHGKLDQWYAQNVAGKVDYEGSTFWMWGLIIKVSWR